MTRGGGVVAVEEENKDSATIPMPVDSQRPKAWGTILSK